MRAHAANTRGRPAKKKARSSQAYPAKPTPAVPAANSVLLVEKK